MTKALNVQEKKLQQLTDKREKVTQLYLKYQKELKVLDKQIKEVEGESFQATLKTYDLSFSEALEMIKMLGSDHEKESNVSELVPTGGDHD